MKTRADMLLKGDILADGSRIVSVSRVGGMVACALEGGAVIELPKWYLLDVERPPQAPDEPSEPPDMLPGIEA